MDINADGSENSLLKPALTNLGFENEIESVAVPLGYELDLFRDGGFFGPEWNFVGMDVDGKIVC